jgi:hypothetical protein
MKLPLDILAAREAESLRVAGNMANSWMRPEVLEL